MKRTDTTATNERRTTPTTAPSVQSNPDAGVITLPQGLMGFPKQTRFVLLASPEEAPFLRLQCVDDPDLRFVVIAPTAVADNYQPDVSEEDTQFLGLSATEDALVFNIVSVQPDGESTVNLKGPIVVNRRTLVGRQVIPVNAADCPVRHTIRGAAA